MDINYRENNSLFGLNGIINRRNFIANLLLIEAILQSIFSTPLLILVYTSSDLASKIIAGSQMPLWFNLIMVFSSAVGCFLYMPSVIRRIRDIYGMAGAENAYTVSVIVFIVLFLGSFSPLFHNSLFFVLKGIGLGLVLSLIFLKGKISSNFEQDKIAKFNWGAFIGTWIWGLFNKSYKTLWMIPLTFTLGALPFGIYCGLKGNKWAYGNFKDKENLELFHEKQKFQSAVWLALIPVISFALFMVITTFMMRYTVSYADKHPAVVAKVAQFYIDTQSKAAMEIFDKTDFENGEYKFFINPKIWDNYSFEQKIAIFDMAGGYVVSSNTDSKDIETLMKILAKNNYSDKIKIYSTYNNELLGEYKLDRKELEKLIKESELNPELKSKITEKIRSGYRFNMHPSLP